MSYFRCINSNDAYRSSQDLAALDIRCHEGIPGWQRRRRHATRTMGDRRYCWRNEPREGMVADGVPRWSGTGLRVCLKRNSKMVTSHISVAVLLTFPASPHQGLRRRLRIRRRSRWLLSTNTAGRPSRLSRTGPGTTHRAKRGGTTTMCGRRLHPPRGRSIYDTGLVPAECHGQGARLFGRDPIIEFLIKSAESPGELSSAAPGNNPQRDRAQLADQADRRSDGRPGHQIVPAFNARRGQASQDRPRRTFEIRGVDPWAYVAASQPRFSGVSKLIDSKTTGSTRRYLSGTRGAVPAVTGRPTPTADRWKG